MISTLPLWYQAAKVWFIGRTWWLQICAATNCANNYRKVWLQILSPKEDNECLRNAGYYNYVFSSLLTMFLLLFLTSHFLLVLVLYVHTNSWVGCENEFVFSLLTLLQSKDRRNKWCHDHRNDIQIHRYVVYVNLYQMHEYWYYVLKITIFGAIQI